MKFAAVIALAAMVANANALPYESLAKTAYAVLAPRAASLGDDLGVCKMDSEIVTFFCNMEANLRQIEYLSGYALCAGDISYKAYIAFCEWDVVSPFDGTCKPKDGVPPPTYESICTGWREIDPVDVEEDEDEDDSDTDTDTGFGFDEKSKLATKTKTAETKKKTAATKSKSQAKKKTAAAKKNKSKAQTKTKGHQEKQNKNKQAAKKSKTQQQHNKSKTAENKKKTAENKTANKN